MRYAKAIVLALFGVSVLVLTIAMTIDGTKAPSAGKTIAIALLGVIGVPPAFAAIGSAVRALRRPDAALLRQEAEARERTAAALEDAATAELLKSELDAFVALRARRLEIDRRREELRTSAVALVMSYRELNNAEIQLGVDQSSIDPEVARVLGELVDLHGDRVYQTVMVYVRLIERIISIMLPIVNPGFMQNQVEDLFRALERRRLRRLSRLAPEALSTNDRPVEVDSAT